MHISIFYNPGVLTVGFWKDWITGVKTKAKLKPKTTMALDFNHLVVLTMSLKGMVGDYKNFGESLMIP